MPPRRRRPPTGPRAQHHARRTSRGSRADGGGARRGRLVDTRDLALFTPTAACASSAVSTTPSSSPAARRQRALPGERALRQRAGSTGPWWWARAGPSVAAFLRRAAPTRGAGAHLGLTRTTPRRSSPTSASSSTTARWHAISGDARRFAPYERVHHVRPVAGEFRIGRELSQTLKLRRHEFLRLYSGEIDELYTL